MASNAARSPNVLEESGHLSFAPLLIPQRYRSRRYLKRKVSPPPSEARTDAIRGKAYVDRTADSFYKLSCAGRHVAQIDLSKQDSNHSTFRR
jgi:hypothetical protein